MLIDKVLKYYEKRGDLLLIALLEEDTSLEEFTDVPIDSGDFVHVQKTHRGAIFFNPKGKRFMITYLLHDDYRIYYNTYLVAYVHIYLINNSPKRAIDHRT